MRNDTCRRHCECEVYRFVWFDAQSARCRPDLVAGIVTCIRALESNSGIPNTDIRVSSLGIRVQSVVLTPVSARGLDDRVRFLARVHR
jgi:hypothetical protein